MERSGIQPIKWSLFVDTDSLYRHTRQLFGVSARMDYQDLPKKIMEHTRDIEFFSEKIALVMRLGKNWDIFSESMSGFGYKTIPADRGTQQIIIATQIMSLLNVCDGIAIVTSSDKILPLVQKMEEDGCLYKIISFSRELFEGDKFFENVLLMDQDWLWHK